MLPGRLRFCVPPSARVGASGAGVIRASLMGHSCAPAAARLGESRRNDMHEHLSGRDVNPWSRTSNHAWVHVAPSRGARDLPRIA